MSATSPEPGDSFLLFHTLPYNFDADLPLTLGPNVYLDATPQSTLDSVDPPALADYVLPGYNLPGLGLTNCCLRCPATETRPADLEPSNLFFNSITALRLRVPLPIEIAGQFKLGSDDDLIQNPTLYELMSPWQPDPNARYSGEDVGFADEIARRLLHVAQSGYRRLNSAAVFFAQVTCGHSKSLQMAYLALFAALDSLFVPQRNKAKTLSRRATQFLSHSMFPGSLNDWLKNEYEKGRNELAHGVQDIVPWTKTRPQRVEAFGRLHEITRLCILGFLSLDNSKLASHSTNTGQQLQNFLDALDPATGRFIDGQRFWCT